MPVLEQDHSRNFCYNSLMLSTLGKNFSRWHFKIFLYFSQKTGFDISCKLSPLETIICMKCQACFLHYMSKPFLRKQVLTFHTDVKTCLLWKNKNIWNIKTISQKTGFEISCKLYPLETIHMKHQNPFSGKNKKNIISLSSAELVKRAVKVNLWWTLNIPTTAVKTATQYTCICVTLARHFLLVLTAYVFLEK